MIGVFTFEAATLDILDKLAIASSYALELVPSLIITFSLSTIVRTCIDDLKNGEIELVREVLFGRTCNSTFYVKACKAFPCLYARKRREIESFLR